MGDCLNALKLALRRYWKTRLDDVYTELIKLESVFIEPERKLIL